MTNIEITRYDGSEQRWNEFVSQSKNATFMHNREYMEYHSDVFDDFSLYIHDKGELVGLLPASVEDGVVSSHAGLTFAGLLTNERMKNDRMLSVFDALLEFLSAESVETLRYKCIPQIYHSLPAEEDRYALFRIGAELYRRDVSSVVDFDNPIEYQKTRRRKIDDAESAGLEVRESSDLEAYWNMLQTNLAQKHDTAPVHTVDEIQLLQDRFPNNIKLHASFEDNQMVGGVITYVNDQTVRAQYIASNERGREIGALDIVFDRLLTQVYDDKRFFDFGISTEEGGTVLNEGLSFFKEGFGARGIVHDFYEVSIDG